MSGVDIDSFFKTKDKKKKSKNNRVINPADLLKSINDTENKTVKKNNEKSTQNTETSKESYKRNKEDDEWEDNDDVPTIDLSRLKFSTIVPSTEVEKQATVTQDEKSDTESDNKKDKTSDNPWSKQHSKPQAVEIEMEKSTPEPTSNVPEKYIPPSQRQGGDIKKARGKVPNITNSLEFPTLGEVAIDAQVNAATDDGEGCWKRVGTTTQTTAVTPTPAPVPQQPVQNTTNKYVPPHLRNKNRFSALRDEGN